MRRTPTPGAQTQVYFITQAGIAAERVQLSALGFGLVISRSQHHTQTLEKLIPCRYGYMIDGARLWPIVAHDWPEAAVTFPDGCTSKYARWEGPVFLSPEACIAISPGLTPRAGDFEAYLSSMIPTVLHAWDFNAILALFTSAEARCG